MTRRSWLGVGLAAAVVLTAGACSDDDPDRGQAALEVDGLAAVERADGTQLRIDDRLILEPGDVATMVEGTAELAMFGGTVLELRTDAEGNGSSVRVDAAPTLLAGDALVLEGAPAVLQVGDVPASVFGKARVDAETSQLAVYSGRASFTAAGEPVDVPALRQAAVDAAGVEPLAYDGADQWDRRFLADAISFGERLEGLARGYTADLRPGEGTTSGFFRQVVPALDEEREFTDDLLETGRAPGETLVGASIVVQGRAEDFRARWRRVFEFRDAGAAWGLVALDQQVSSAPLLQAIELALGGSPLSDEPPSPTNSTTTSTTRTPNGTSTTTTTEPTNPPPTPPPTDPDPISPLDPVVDPVDGLLDTLLDSLGVLPPDDDDGSGGGLLGGLLGEGGLLGGLGG